MINFKVLYPYDPNAHFDFDYYLKRHAVMVREKTGSALRSITLERGVSGLKSSSAPAYHAVATLCFDSLEELKSSLYPHLAAISADIPNFTAIAPRIEIAEIVE
jgi:uncharacterized protein (TIGR02118 family)